MTTMTTIHLYGSLPGCLLVVENCIEKSPLHQISVY
jgi:hypothetical protein